MQSATTRWNRKHGPTQFKGLHHPRDPSAAASYQDTTIL
jgi:hypothetical protein